ncbi:YciI-like protein [Hartmannibacter diazotrophicus]|uniref:YciI-like protein n=1 Tax=Hartmannibacter diazotrophicus TaxID=1482074 RepID=A0A2C9D244_9HYPH|nr:YciI family protein [Hartmannibacter diazotrophicus]SON53871.1 YciI-like protein [Hartmannibacter diazotrophicus]
MLFVVSCIDKPGALQVRMDNRPAHLEFLDANKDVVKVGGPYMSEDGTSPTGSMLIIDAADRAALDALIAEDPYAKAGLFQSVDVRPWRRTVGAEL